MDTALVGRVFDAAEIQGPGRDWTTAAWVPFCHATAGEVQCAAATEFADCYE